jgi:hypothetical protein
VDPILSGFDGRRSAPPPVESAAPADRAGALGDMLAYAISAPSEATRRTPAVAATLANLEIGAAEFISAWFGPAGPLVSAEIGHQFADLFLRGIAGRKDSQGTSRNRGTRTRAGGPATSHSTA